MPLRPVARRTMPLTVSTTRTILLVEDEESITEPLTAALAREGWATHVTASAKAAPGLVDSVLSPISCCST